MVRTASLRGHPAREAVERVVDLGCQRVTRRIIMTTPRRRRITHCIALGRGSVFHRRCPGGYACDRSACACTRATLCARPGRGCGRVCLVDRVELVMFLTNT